MSKVTMYRGIDKLDGTDTMFAVRGNDVVKSYCSGDDDAWATPDGFGSFDRYGLSQYGIDSEMHDHVTGMMVIWEE